MKKYDDWNGRIDNIKDIFGNDTDTDDEIEYPFTEGFLRNDILEYKIKNKIDYLNTKDILESKKVLKYTDDLDIDNEQRIHESQFGIQRRYVDHDKIVFRNSQNITITNCIINGDIYISGETSKGIRVSFDNSIFLGKIKIYAAAGSFDISIKTCNIKEIIFENCSIEKLSISYSRIFDLNINLCKINNFNTNNNSFNFFSCVNNKLENVTFSHQQLSRRAIKNRKYSKKRINKYLNKFNLFNKWNNFNINMYNSSKDDHLKTLEFVEKYSRVNSDRNFKAIK